MNTAHKFVEDSSIFEDIENRTVEVVPINAAHEAVRIAKKEAYNDVVTLINNAIDRAKGNDPIYAEFVLLGLLADVKNKIK